MSKTRSMPILNCEVPQYAYALAVLSGGGAYVTAQLVAPLTAWLAYAIIAALFSLIWPYKPMQWGVWICLPIALLIVFDVIATGNIVSLFLFSGVMLVKALFFACLGAYVGSKIPIREIASLASHRKSSKKSRGVAQRGLALKKPMAIHANVETFSSSHSASHSALWPELVAHLNTLNDALTSVARESDINRIKLPIADGPEVKTLGGTQGTLPGLGTLDFDVKRCPNLFIKGASLEPSEGKGWTPLMIATIEGHAEVARTLLAQGAQIDAENYEGWTALRFAVSMNETSILRLLLDAGANANIADHEGQTALMQAARENSRDSLKALLNAGADPLIEDNHQQTALRIAREHNHIEIICLLEEAATKPLPGIEVPVSANGVELSVGLSPCEGLD